MDQDDTERAYGDSPAAFMYQTEENEDNYFTEKRDGLEADGKEGEDIPTQHEERRSLRPSRSEKRHSYQEYGEESDIEVGSDAEDFHQICLVGAAVALKQYFFNRLEQTLVFLGGSADLLKGWKVQVLKRSGGLTLGLLEVFYFSHRGRKFMSRVEVACFFNLMPTAKSLRNMTKDQFYLNAIENRERHLISQQLALCNYTCDKVVFHNDIITLEGSLLHDTATEGEKAVSQLSPEDVPLPASLEAAKKRYFSYGNLVVLDWGRIIPDTAFHTNTQIFPLGFKCLRQEHDVVLDRVVDCLCEIDAVFEGGDGTSVLSQLRNNQPIDPHKPLLPLFRLSVAWHVGDESSIGTATEQEHVKVRVYEARSVQQVWQAAMLENLGIPHKEDGAQSAAGSRSDLNAGNGGDHDEHDAAMAEDTDGGNVTDNASVEEDQDEEEIALRQKIREQRRAYFRVLRAEQSAGMQAAVRPRLSLDSVDSFCEELILRLFEGMEGSINCRNYQYIDSREREGGKKNLQKCYSKAFNKAKNLDRVIRKNQYLSEQIQQLEQKRRRVEDQETRKRAKIEDKETRSLVATAQKLRTAKMKELERSVTMLKVAMTKTVKKRRDDAKLAAEIMCDKEEIQRFARSTGQTNTSPPALQASTDCAEMTMSPEQAQQQTGPRPEPPNGSLVLDGNVVGHLLEVWEFLRTFRKDLSLAPDPVPNFDLLVSAAKIFDPAYRSVRDYVRCLDHSYDRVTQFPPLEPTDSEAADVLNSLGVALTGCLLKDFERIMGIDLAEMQLGNVRVPVNALTWREIARVVLLGNCCRDVGMSELDLAGLLKGRGYFTTPESADRKVLKLARRRIKFAYGIRSELQESVYGFSSGLCVRLPAPGNPFVEGCVMWSDLIASLKNVPDSSGWLVYEVIKAAALSVCIIDTSPTARKLKRSLLDTLGLPSFRMNNATETKAAALKILEEEQLASQQWQYSNGRWKSTASSATSASGGVSSAASADGKSESEAVQPASMQDAAQLLRAKIEMVYDQTPYTLPTCTLDVWEKQMREAMRHADFAKPNGAAMTPANEEPESERDLTSAMEDDGEVEADTADGQSERNDGKEDEPAAPVAQLVVDDDTKQAEKLSIAMQRCYLVIRDLMMHPQVTAFNWPVDYNILPAYYKSVAQPLSFSELRAFLVEGKYKDNIFHFYTDVLLVIENAMAYNQENSTVKLAAQKLLIVFERLFFETVLCWDNALPFHDSCHACRSPHPIPAGKMAVCDRCEGCYHLHCLDPPMQMPPRSEWYCLPCVEQKGVTSAHPYKTADVQHPADPESRGEVVGMEQIRQTIMFVVAFGNVREMWDGQKVRRYAIEPCGDAPVTPKGVFSLMDEADRRKGALGFVTTVGSSAASAADSASQSSEFQPIAPVESVFAMPSGYNYEDYDRVCGIARAYTGWGASHYLVPPVIMDQHNLAAASRSRHEVLFPQYRACVAMLGYAAGGALGDMLCSNEWATLLKALLHRVLDGNTINAGLAALDDSVDDDLIAQIQDGVHNNSLPLEKVFGFIRGEGLVKLVKPAPVEPNPDAPRRGRKRRVQVDASAPGPLKRSISASSAVGEEDQSDDEDGEDEWDEDVDESAPSLAKKAAEEKKAGPAKGAKKGGKRGKRVGIVEGEEDEAAVGDLTPAKITAEPADEADSADDDDLEFFDADGNCLTSGTEVCVNAPPAQTPVTPTNAPANGDYGVGCDMEPNREISNVSPAASAEGAVGTEMEVPVIPEPEGPETEDGWNLRLLSRQKGREDALLTHSLVYDVITQLDVDGLKEQEDEAFRQLQQEDMGGSFYQAATTAIVKSCVGRPSESLVAQEWNRGWDGKMASMEQYHAEYTFKDKELLCPVCGFDESYLGSPMVWGQTGEEWEADVKAETAQDVLTEPEAPTDANAFPLAAGVSASTGIKGFRARARVMKGLVWMPYDPVEAELEEAECAAMKRTIKKGSLVMHECCANFVHFNRQMKQDKSKKMEDQRVVEVISGIGRAKSTPIGVDREGSFYWIFRDCSALFVSSSTCSTLREQAAVPQQAASTSRWSVYRSDAAINTILTWLDPKVSTERVLKKVLSVLFPGAVTTEDESTKPSASAVTAPEPVATDGAMEVVTESEGTAKTEVTAEAETTPQVTSVGIVHVRPTGSLLLSGDIMEQSGDEAGSDDEAFAARSTAPVALKTAGADGEDQEEDDAHTVDTAEAMVVVNETSNGEGASSTKSSKELALAQQRRDEADAALLARPALSARNPLLDIYCPVEEGLTRVDKKTSARSASFKFRKGEHVLVDASPRNHVLWDAHVLECKAYRLPPQDPADSEVVQILFYKLRFDRWSAAYDGWYEECQLLSSSAMVSAVGRPRITARAVAQESKMVFVHEQAWTPPAILKTLTAFQFMKEPLRACGIAPPLNYSDCRSAIGQLRTAMLMIEAALPIGAVDDSEDRWGDDFAVPWREAVSVASDAVSLMQCQLMLEYGIRTSWLKPTGLKMFSCLPSRVQCVRNATCSLVAIRVWVLDATIKYDQVKKEDKPVGSGKGRPPKHPGTSGSGSGSKAGKKGR